MNVRSVVKYLSAGLIVHVLFIACNDDHPRKEAIRRLMDAGEDVVGSLLPDGSRHLFDSGTSSMDGTASMDAKTHPDALTDALVHPIRDAKAQDASSQACCTRTSPESTPENALRGAVGPVAAPATYELAVGPLFLTEVVHTTAAASSANLYTAAVGSDCGSVAATDDPLFSLRTSLETPTAIMNGARFFVPADRKLCAQIGANLLFSWAGFRP